MTRYQIKNEGKTPRFITERGVLLGPGEETTVHRVDDGTWRAPDLKVTDLQAPVPVPVVEAPVQELPVPAEAPPARPEPVRTVELEAAPDSSVEVKSEPAPSTTVAYEHSKTPKTPGRRSR